MDLYSKNKLKLNYQIIVRFNLYKNVPLQAKNNYKYEVQPIILNHLK